MSFHSDLYFKIPETHLLKRIEKAVDFSFINELLADSYCKDFGRPAREPEMMMKLLFLQRIYVIMKHLAKRDFIGVRLIKIDPDGNESIYASK